jgi:phosphatidate cytidylyltransferase
MRRLLTAAVMAPLALAAVFLLAPLPFFGVMLVAAEVVALEIVAVGRRWTRGPLRAIYPLAAACGLALCWPAVSARVPPDGELVAGVLALALGPGAAVLVLLCRTPTEETVAAVGLISFVPLYVGVPLAALVRVQAADPWLVFLLLAVVSFGDTAAYYVGIRFGRSLLAPRVSPKKTWEGALAGVATAIVASLAFCLWRFGAVDWLLVGLASLTSVAGQLGDLAQSLLKRAAGVKDSGTFLPGHGGAWDRLDALLVAAPVWWLGLKGLERL